MKYFKHIKTKQFLFIDSKPLWFETFRFNMVRNQIKTDYEYSEKDNKKDLAKKLASYISKYEKKGFEEKEITQPAIDKTNAFCEKIEIGKSYYFHIKNTVSLMKEKVVEVKVTKDPTNIEKYRVCAFETDGYDDKSSFSTLSDYLNGSIRLHCEETNDFEVLETLMPKLWMLFTLGFEWVTEQFILEKIAGKSINLEQEYEADIYKQQHSFSAAESCVKVNFFEEDLLVVTHNYFLLEEKIIGTKQIYSTFQTIEEFKEGRKNIETYYKDSDSLKWFMSEVDFKNKYPVTKDAIQYFQAPELIKATRPNFPINVPQGKIDFPIGSFYANLVNVNRLYFYVNEEGDDPMEWKAAFIVLKNLETSVYLATKVFTLKNFNKIYANTEESEALKYSSDLEEFFKKKAKSYKKAKLKPYDTEKIIELLSQNNLTDLNNQKSLESFCFQGNYFKHIVDCYKNYANIWIAGNDKIHYLQFFKDEKSRMEWLNKTRPESTVDLYPTEMKRIKDFIDHISSNDDAFKLKENLSNNNAKLKEYLKSDYNKKRFLKTNCEIIEDDWEVDGDLILSRNQSLLLRGNLKVNGTLFFTSSSNQKYSNNPFLIIEGNVIVQNLLMNGGFEYLQIDGDFIVTELAACSYSKDRNNFNINGSAETNILLHRNKNASSFKPCFDFKKEVGPFSNAVLEPSIFSKDKYDSMNVEHPIVFDFLKEGKKFLSDNIEETVVNLDEYYQLEFERRMKNWGNFYPAYAGCEELGISEDNEIKGNGIYPGSGDWVVNDLRGKSGTYGVSHEDYSICKLKVKMPTKFGIDYKQKPLKLMLSAEELMNRYIRISMLYMNWAHRKTVSFEIENTDEVFQKEKEVFKDDPHLALYWLNHFGATLDQRYHEVVKIIEVNKLTEELEILREPLAFFKRTNAFYDLKIGTSSSGEKDFENLFLKRRSFLVYIEQVYKNYKPENLELWWKSICIYPKVEENLIVRMRWLKNNLNKCNNWSDFEELIKDEDKNIPLLSYVLSCNPNTSKKDKTKYANILIAELYEHKNHFKTPHKKQFAEILLWDVRDFVSDKEKLQEVAKFYFKGNETSKEYQDIQSILGIKNENIEDIKAALEKLNNAFAGYDRFKTTAQEKAKYHSKIVSILEEFTPDILLETAHNIQNHELAKRYFVYLWQANILNKKEALIRLFIFIELADYDISYEMFGEQFSKLLKDDDDPNKEIAKALLNIPEADFRNDSMWKNSKQAAAKFFLNSAHQPKTFDFLIETVKQAPTKENQQVIDAIYTSLFSTDYKSNINPVLKFSKEQVECMLETICDWFLKYGYQAEGYRSIYYCANPLAEDWIKEHKSNKKWLNKFAHISTFYDPLDEELKDAFVSALEFIQAEKHNTYLEFKDDKSHKFWGIAFYGEAYIVTYGKIGTEGRKSEKTFKTEKECYKAGDKLIEQKLKKGYLKTEK